MKTPHKHCELIKAWADGAEIEFHIGENEWDLVGQPSWRVEQEYRIKPEPKPDLIKYYEASGEHISPPTIEKFGKDSLKLTFDGETGKLKSAEVIS